MNPGDIVRVIDNPSRTGVVTPSGRRFFGEVERVQVSFTDGAMSSLSVMALEPVPQHHSPDDEMKRGQCVGAEATRRILLHEKLSGRLAGVLYSMETSDSSGAPDDVGAVLGFLQGALGDEEHRIRTEGAQAMQKGDFDTATAVIEFRSRPRMAEDRIAVV